MQAQVFLFIYCLIDEHLITCRNYTFIRKCFATLHNDEIHAQNKEKIQKLINIRIPFLFSSTSMYSSL